MYRLLEITYTTDKESQAIYPVDTKDALEGEYEDKLGTNMLANIDCILIGLDNIGNVLFSAKDGEHEFAPRLYEAKTTTEEVVDLTKCDTVEVANGRFHKKKGSAIKDVNCKQEVLIEIDGNAAIIGSFYRVRNIEPAE